MKGEQPAKSVLSACLIYLISGGITVLWLSPRLLAANSTVASLRPGLYVTAFILSVLVSIQLWAVRHHLKFSRKWLNFAIAYNVLIILVKFIISPATFTAKSNVGLVSYILTGLAVMVLYVLGFWLVYAFFCDRLPIKPSGKGLAAMQQRLYFASITFILINFLRLVIQRLPLPTVSAGSNYLNAVFGYQGLALSIIIFGVVITAVESFAEISHARLKTFLWLGLSLIAVDHILWVIFMNRLGA